MKEEVIKSMSEPPLKAPPLFFSTRMVICVMCSCAYFVAYFFVLNLGMVFVCMDTVSGSHNVSNSLIEEKNSGNCTNTTQTGCLPDIDTFWSKNDQGLLLGAAAYGVVAAYIPSGWMTDKFGQARLQMITGQVVVGVVSLLSPLLVLNSGFPYIFVARIIQGIGVCSVMNPILPLVGRWSVPTERGLLIGIAFAGMGLARSLAYPVAGLLCKSWGWESIFYFTGFCNLLWGVLAMFLVHNSPLTHPRVSVVEKQYLISSLSKNAQSKKKKKVIVPWKKMLTSVPVWSVIVSLFFFLAAQAGVIINLPLYVRDVFDFSVAEVGIFSALPSVSALVVQLAAGPLFDYFRARKLCSITNLRKIFHAIGTFFPAVLMFVASQLDYKSKYAIMTVITIGHSLTEVAFMGGLHLSFLDMTPDFVGILVGIARTITSTTGFIIPFLVAFMTPNRSQEEWSYVFAMFGALYLVACLSYVITGKSTLRSWGESKDSAVKPIESKTPDQEKP